jgi:hypothetical protein
MAHLLFRSMDDILIVKISGQLSSNIRPAIMEYFSFVRASGLFKVLVDLRDMQGRISITDTYLMAREVFPAKNERVTAIVENEQRREYSELHKLALENAGYRDIHLFYEFDDAFNWLSKIPNNYQ